MKNTIRGSIAFLLGFIVLIFPLHSQGWTGDTLAYKWDILSMEENGQKNDFDRRQNYRLLIDSNGTLTLFLDTLKREGEWSVNGDSLFLSFQKVDIQRGIDSISYYSNEDSNRMIFFSEGEKIADLSGGDLDSRRRREAYHMEWTDEGGIRLISREKQLVLGKRTLKQGSFALSDLLRGVLGILVMLGIAVLFSTNRKAINWRLVLIGISLQILVAVLVLQVPGVGLAIQAASKGMVNLLNYSKAGAIFMFGDLADSDSFGNIFAFQILPTIVFFSAIMSVLYYLGILQRIVYGFAWIMNKTMNLSGAESLAAAGNIFVGQTEAPLLIKPYLDKMTRSEIMALMTGGFATIAGGVFAAYVTFLGGGDEKQAADFAKHLITASVMSAPAALVLAKIMVPETEETQEDLSVPKEKIGTNILDALSNGITDGLKLAVNVGVMLMVFTAIMALLNSFFGDCLGAWTGLNDWVREWTEGRYQSFDLTFILGLVGAPFAWLMGVPQEDILLVGQLLGEKTILNEFYAYTSLGELMDEGVVRNYKSVVIATYALCGFANFASIGIQIGGIGALAPGQRKNLSELSMRALLGGTFAAFLTASIAGMLIFV